MIEFSGIGFTLFGVSVRWYGFIIACAILVAVFLCTAREKRYGLPAETCLNIALLAVPFGIIGARVYYVLFNLEYYAEDPFEMFMIHHGGLAIYGGIIGGAAAVLVYCAVKKLKFLKLADVIAPALALAQAIGRWGNYFNQEAYGAAITDPALQVFPIAVQLDGGSWHYATFFYESVWCALICVLLLILEAREKDRRDGGLFMKYCFLYAAERFLVEGLRMDSLMIGQLRVSHLLSFAVLLAVGLILCARGGNRGLALKLCLMFSLVLLACAAALLPFAYAIPFALLTAVLGLVTDSVVSRTEP